MSEHASPRGMFQLFPTRRGMVGWRYLGANNRELARGPVEYDDVESAVLEVKRLRHDIDGLRSRLSRDPGGRWQWILVDGAGLTVAVAAAGYDRRVRCAQALARFVDGIPTADVRSSRLLRDASSLRGEVFA